MIAFTGTRLSAVELYERIHELGMLTILGTLGNLDDMAEARGDSLYQIWHEMGADILSTDRPFAAAAALE